MIGYVRSQPCKALTPLALMVLGIVFSPPMSAAAERGSQIPAPDHASDDSLLQLAQADVDNSDYNAAAEKYASYLAAHPDDAQIHFQLGYCETAMKRPDLARAEYEKATELNPALAPAFLNLGLTLIDRHPEDAIAPLRRAVELMPGEEKPQMFLAVALGRTGRTDETLAAFASAETADSNDVQLHLAYGDFLLGIKRLTDAEHQYRAAIDADRSEAGGFYGLAQCLIAEKKYDDAVASLAAYLKLRPDDKDVHARRGDLLITMGRYDEAGAEFQAAGIDQMSGAMPLLLQYADLMDAKRYDDALALLLSAEMKYPDDPTVHRALGRWYMQRKNYPDGIREFQAVLAHQPNDTDALAALANAEYLTKDYSGALDIFDILVQKESLDLSELYVRADSYDKIGKKAEALNAYETFLRVNTDQNTDMYFAASQRARDLRRELGKK